MKSDFRLVPDTNVIVSSQSNTPTSPNSEILDRWFNNEFQILYSDDTVLEYVEKLLELEFPQAKIERLVASFVELAERVEIAVYHFLTIKYPDDPDDIAFVLCADNGNATHLVTYDSDILDVAPYHSFTICKPIPFLKELREALKSDQN